jgi:SAM-dependent methyltransferase
VNGTLKTSKLTAEEMRLLYQGVHREAMVRKADDLDPVIHPGASAALNQFEDFAHRLGMTRALRYVGERSGELAGKRVLDLGCGRGRWVKEYAERGAVVTGVDVSSDAVELLRPRFPSHVFVCGDLAALDLEPASFEIANSVTVLQHLPPESQAEALRRVERALKPGAYFVLLENISDFDAAWVFPHTRRGWIAMVESAGLRLCASWGSNFDVLQRIARFVMRGLRLRRTASAEEIKSHRDPSHSPLRQRMQGMLAVLSYPVEWFCSVFPIVTPTHAVMIFEKPGAAQRSPLPEHKE